MRGGGLCNTHLVESLPEDLLSLGNFLQVIVYCVEAGVDGVLKLSHGQACAVRIGGCDMGEHAINSDEVPSRDGDRTIGDLLSRLQEQIEEFVRVLDGRVESGLAEAGELRLERHHGVLFRHVGGAILGVGFVYVVISGRVVSLKCCGGNIARLMEVTTDRSW